MSGEPSVRTVRIRRARLHDLLYNWNAASGDIMRATIADAADVLDAAARCAMANASWRPIETAPKDGEEIVDLWVGGSDPGRYTDCWWNGVHWLSYTRGTSSVDYDPPLWVVEHPTHWMLPPEPPGDCL